jgi:hypothetical protein
MTRQTTKPSRIADRKFMRALIRIDWHFERREGDA